MSKPLPAAPVTTCRCGESSSASSVDSGGSRWDPEMMCKGPLSSSTASRCSRSATIRCTYGCGGSTCTTPFLTDHAEKPGISTRWVTAINRSRCHGTRQFAIALLSNKVARTARACLPINLDNAVELVNPPDYLLLSIFSCLSWPPIWCSENRSCGPAARRTVRRNGSRHFEHRATPQMGCRCGFQVQRLNQFTDRRRADQCHNGRNEKKSAYTTAAPHVYASSVILSGNIRCG